MKLHFAFLFLILACQQLFAAELAEEQLAVEGINYLAVVAEPKQVRIYWSDPASGKPFRQFGAMQAYLEAKGDTVRMLMNGGIFEPGGIPSGLLVQDGKEQHPLNLNAGRGNFFLKPNGVFYIRNGKAGILETEAFHRAVFVPDFAVQSGPLLLEAGRIHPAFTADSSSRLHRNAVGVRRDGKVLFLITPWQTDRRPNLYEFASAFRKLGCENALFLDGDLSQMALHPKNHAFPNEDFGSIIAVLEPKR